MTDIEKMLCCFQIIESPFMSDSVQAKTHKKKRINKKWKKRYGTREIPKNDILITNDGKIIAHPKIVNRIKNEIMRRNVL